MTLTQWCAWFAQHLETHSTVDASIVECLLMDWQARENAWNIPAVIPSASHDAAGSSNLPLPRLELRWTQEDELEHWLCRYRLVFPCVDHREVAKQGWALVELGETRRGSVQAPVDHQGTVDTPFRDGVHCRRDAAVLHLPAYAVYGKFITTLEPIDWQARETTQTMSLPHED